MGTQTFLRLIEVHAEVLKAKRYLDSAALGGRLPSSRKEEYKNESGGPFHSISILAIRMEEEAEQILLVHISIKMSPHLC